MTWEEYRDKYTPWPEDLPTRRQAVMDRMELDKLDLVNADTPRKAKHIRNRIFVAEQWLLKNQ